MQLELRVRDYEQCERSLKTCKADLDACQQQLELCQSELSSVRESHNQEVERLQGECRGLSDKLSMTESDGGSARKELDGCKQELEACRGEMEQLRRALNAAESTSAEAVASVARTKSLLLEVDSAKAKLEDEVALLGEGEAEMLPRPEQREQPHRQRHRHAAVEARRREEVQAVRPPALQVEEADADEMKYEEEEVDEDELDLESILKELEDEADEGEESPALGGGEEVGVALKVALDHGGSELLIRKSAVAAARDDGLDVRVLVRPVEERIEAV